LPHVNESWTLSTDFRKILIKIRPVKFDLLHAGGRTDRQTELTKLIFAFLNFAEISNNASIVYCETQVDHTLIIAFYHITSLWLVSTQGCIIIIRFVFFLTVCLCTYYKDLLFPSTVLTGYCTRCAIIVFSGIRAKYLIDSTI
jgi:hypothetical protein